MGGMSLGRQVDDDVRGHMAVKEMGGRRTGARREEAPAPGPVTVPAEYEAVPAEPEGEE